MMPDSPDVTKKAKDDVKKALEQLESTLKSSPYLIGSFISLADIVVVCSLREAFQKVFDPAFRKPFPKVIAWFEGCCGMPQFKAVLGAVQLCKEAAKPIPVKPEFQQAAAAPKNEAAPKKEAAPSKAKDEKKPSAAAPAGGDLAKI